jgi:putative PEP-CTERM system histidine kinase
MTAGGASARGLIAALRGISGPADFDAPRAEALALLKRYHPDYFPEEGGHRIAVPLTAGGELLGVVTVGDRVRAIPYTVEELDLLATIGSQVAAGLLNLRLSQRLLDAKQFEAFQAMSTFFVHDLKNTASTLSLMLQNLPEHFDEPAFREDALQAVSHTVNRINGTVRRLSSLRQLQITPAVGDFNELVRSGLQGIHGACRRQIEERFGNLPPVAFDSDAMQKVVVNLVLNACEAVGADGKVVVETSCPGGWVILVVSDNGGGMPPDFIASRLFRPFQTRKKDGMGIGLYQSRMIVEAHRGRIEVESKEGEGSTFRVLLPAAA